jgi:hypothetical protein
MQCFDLETDQVLWEKIYPAGCDRSCVTADGKKVYVPNSLRFNSAAARWSALAMSSGWAGRICLEHPTQPASLVSSQRQRQPVTSPESDSRPGLDPGARDKIEPELLEHERGNNLRFQHGKLAPDTVTWP